ncbi:MAG: ATP-binding cassette domain-containing protein [Treponema sp.]|nr:ATP-binding cassette domain-containing protein [Treponema sp.]
MSILFSIKKRLSPTFTLDVSFQHSGDACIGILGASGCGKSMTLKCVAGIETPDEGVITVNDRTLFDSRKKINIRPQKRQVGYLFQNYALFPRMTVLENITAALSAQGKQERLDKARLWLARFELVGLENQYPSTLSGGQQQRTALARMLIREPSCVLLDEPFSALDTTLREQMQARFLELFSARGNVLLVTHNRDEAYKLCAALVIMDHGQILQQGTTREIFERPASVRVARITGCKNIASVKRLGEREIHARDWGLTLRTAEPVADGVTHVGIRAHDLRPAANEAYNQIRTAIVQRSEDPFERVVIFTNADAVTPGLPTGELWWKYSKYLPAQHDERLFIPPDALLLLKA